MSRAKLAFAATVLFLAPLAFTEALPLDATGDPNAAAAPAPATPMMAAIDAALMDEHARVAELAARLATAPDDTTALALHRAIEQAKTDAKLRVFAIQAEFARREGRLEDAQQMEAAIAAMDRVEVHAVVEPRPAPDTAASGR